MRTIDDAIQQSLDVEKSLLAIIDDDKTTDLNYVRYCAKCAAEQRLLAEWLKELKAYQTLLDRIKEIKRNFYADNQDYYTGYVCALSMVEGLIATITEKKK